MVRAGDHPLTVGELIELLRAYDSNATVQLEGCDCMGEAFSVQGYNEEWDPRPPETATMVEIQREQGE